MQLNLLITFLDFAKPQCNKKWFPEEESVPFSSSAILVIFNCLVDFLQLFRNSRMEVFC